MELKLCIIIVGTKLILTKITSFQQYVNIFSTQDYILELHGSNVYDSNRMIYRVKKSESETFTLRLLSYQGLNSIF